MKKFLIPALVLLIILAIAAYFLFFHRTSADTPTTVTTAVETPDTKTPAPGNTAGQTTVTKIEFNGLPDTTADWFDRTGTGIPGENYLDIVSSEIISSGDGYYFGMKLNGPLPTKTTGDVTYIEWDFLIDTDQDPNTGSYWPLISNDIGYDYLVRAGLKGSDRSFEVLNLQTNQFTAVQGQITEDIIAIEVPASITGSLQEFCWATAVRRYLSTDGNGAPSMCDKAPNRGHYLYPAQTTAAATEVSTSDPAGDLFDKERNPADGSEYMDITGVKITRSGDSYTVKISVKGNVPAAISGEEAGMEWDVFIDNDSDPVTGNRWHLVSNDLGYDTIVRGYLDKNGWHGQLYNQNSASSTRIYYRWENNSIELEFPADDIGDPNSFTWTAAFRMYKQNGAATDPAIVDKTPENGHWDFPTDTATPEVSSSHTDAAGDLYNYNGVTTGADYQDIMETSLSRSGDIYTAKIILKGNVPDSTPEKDTFLEWDFFLDAAPYTGQNQWWPFVTVGDKIDYLIRISLQNSELIGELINVQTQEHSDVYFKAEGNVIEIKFPAEAIGSPGDFHWLAATREYPPGTFLSGPDAYDKAPDDQYYVFPDN